MGITAGGPTHWCDGDEAASLCQEAVLSALLDAGRPASVVQSGFSDGQLLPSHPQHYIRTGSV